MTIIYIVAISVIGILSFVIIKQHNDLADSHSESLRMHAVASSRESSVEELLNDNRRLYEENRAIQTAADSLIAINTKVHTELREANRLLGLTREYLNDPGAPYRMTGKTLKQHFGMEPIIPNSMVIK